MKTLDKIVENFIAFIIACFVFGVPIWGFINYTFIDFNIYGSISCIFVFLVLLCISRTFLPGKGSL